MSAWNKKDSILVQIYKENTPAFAAINQSCWFYHNSIWLMF